MFERITPIVKNILILTVGVFIIQSIFKDQRGDVVAHYLSLHDFRSEDFYAWQVLSNMFIHANFGHLFNNMLLLFFIGPLLEQRLGDRKFMFIYFFSGIFASLCMMGIYGYLLGAGNWSALGASGATVGILVATAAMYPNMEVYLYFLFPIKLKWIALFTVIMDAIGAVNFSGPSSGDDHIGHIAHLGGAVFSFLLILYWKKKGEVY